jgi:translation initiation factor 2D
MCRKGHAPRIHIIMETRQGRKTVTRILGLPEFVISLDEMAEELRNTCATSASVVEGVAGRVEVMVQGPQSAAVISALESRGVKKQYILLEDKRK